MKRSGRANLKQQKESVRENAKTLCTNSERLRPNLGQKRGVLYIMCRPRSDSASLTLAGLRSVGDHLQRRKEKQEEGVFLFFEEK